MTDLVSAVRAEHAKILRAADHTAEQYSTFPLGEHAARRALHDLVSLAARHEVAEARVLWPVVRDRLPELTEARILAHKQERLARRQLHHLYRARSSPRARDAAPRTAQALREHIGLEESQVLSALAISLSDSEAMSLGLLFERTSARSPTRPHPRTPAIPGVLALVGPLARRVDRVRDLLHLG